MQLLEYALLKIILAILHAMNNVFADLVSEDIDEIRRRIRWHRKAGIPFDPHKF
jgi:hypothetical protein